MFTQEDIELLKSQLRDCYSNYIEMLVEKTGLTRPTISKFFNNKNVRPSTKELIYKTGFSLISQKRDEEKSLTRDLRRIAKGESLEGVQSKLNI